MIKKERYPMPSIWILRVCVSALLLGVIIILSIFMEEDDAPPTRL